MTIALGRHQQIYPLSSCPPVARNSDAGLASVQHNFPKPNCCENNASQKQLRQKTLYMSTTATESLIPTTRKSREDPVLLQHVDAIRATFADHLQSLAFYTDGSWTQLRSPSTAIFKREDQRVRGSAGLVILVDKLASATLVCYTHQ